MALSNYEKQKRWRERNRAVYNLRQRERRLRSRAKDEVKPMTKVEDLRKLIADESKRVVEEVVKRPQIFRDRYGRVISEAQWERLQDMKQRAKEGGYVIDDYSQ